MPRTLPIYIIIQHTKKVEIFFYKRDGLWGPQRGGAGRTASGGSFIDGKPLVLCVYYSSSGKKKRYITSIRDAIYRRRKTFCRSDEDVNQSQHRPPTSNRYFYAIVVGSRSSLSIVWQMQLYTLGQKTYTARRPIFVGCSLCDLMFSFGVERFFLGWHGISFRCISRLEWPSPFSFRLCLSVREV